MKDNGTQSFAINTTIRGNNFCTKHFGYLLCNRLLFLVELMYKKICIDIVISTQLKQHLPN